VPLDRVAHHVRGFNPRSIGIELVNNGRGFNPRSIGIELVNNGRYPDWFDSRRQVMSEPYPAEQIDALVRLVNHLREQLPGLVNVAGHEDLDTDSIPAEDEPSVLIRRKLDPGPHFPWAAFMKRTPLQRLSAEGP